MKRLLIAGIAALALLLAVPAARAARTTDISDLWWVPSESGWGIQFTQAGGLPDYSEMFRFPWSGEYLIRVIITSRPGAKPVETRFRVHHAV